MNDAAHIPLDRSQMQIDDRRADLTPGMPVIVADQYRIASVIGCPVSLLLKFSRNAGAIDDRCKRSARA